MSVVVVKSAAVAYIMKKIYCWSSKNLREEAQRFYIFFAKSINLRRYGQKLFFNCGMEFF